jgi:hypothetical protein
MKDLFFFMFQLEMKITGKNCNVMTPSGQAVKAVYPCSYERAARIESHCSKFVFFALINLFLC